MREAVEIRFLVNGNPMPWEPELVRFPTQTQQPTAVRRVNELRQRLGPTAAISIERRGDIRQQPETPQMFRYSIYVKEGAMLVNDPNGVNGISITELDKATLFSRPFIESEREAVIAKILEMFPKAILTEVKV